MGWVSVWLRNNSGNRPKGSCGETVLDSREGEELGSLVMGFCQKEKSWLMEEFNQVLALWVIRGSLLPVKGAEGTREMVVWKREW